MRSRFHSQVISVQLRVHSYCLSIYLQRIIAPERALDQSVPLDPVVIEVEQETAECAESRGVFFFSSASLRALRGCFLTPCMAGTTLQPQLKHQKRRPPEIMTMRQRLI